MTTTTTAPTAVVFDLAPAARQVVRLLDGVDDAHLDAPTPCAAYTVRDLLAHLLGLSDAFRAAAGKRPVPAVVRDAPLPAGWRRLLPGRLAALAEAWQGRDAWEGTTRAGGVTLPAGVAAQVALDELVLHGWDLARATGQPFRCDRSSLQVVYALLAPEADNPARAPMFGPVVDVPYGSPFLDRVVGLGGRDPKWAPGTR
ncbi:TIGR03086 family metal-binding protein [Streptomyces sp. NPDC004111]|uniref:TIGR03086 family metal-binding protein n=1 Tax=Streptomyces sp. NPDC004111 TaxID=3364690 RepID=UPI00367A3AC1